jgi:hypothetical protein
VPKRSRIVVLVAFAVLAATVVSRFGTTNSRAEFIGNLTASVGPGFEIQLKTADGAVVSRLAAGTYGIHVNDNATEHNFHLEGAGVSMATGVETISVEDWTVDFGDGYYTYHCDRHPSLTATFAAGNAPPLPAPAPTQVLVPTAPSSSSSSVSTPVVVATKSSTSSSSVSSALKVTLSGKDALTVTKGGKALKRVPAGTYTVVVSDASAKRDVSLRRIGGNPSQLTPVSFTGTKTVRVTLTPGQWKLFSAANEQGVFAFFTVTK